MEIARSYKSLEIETPTLPSKTRRPLRNVFFSSLSALGLFSAAFGSVHAGDPDVVRFLPRSCGKPEIAYSDPTHFYRWAEVRDVSTGEPWIVAYEDLGEASVCGEGLDLVEGSIKPAVRLLNSLSPEGRRLVSVLRSIGVRVFYDKTGGANARYGVHIREMRINEDLRHLEPSTLAVTLAHELQHAESLREKDPYNMTPQDCVEEEVQAFQTQILIWRQIYGESGKPNVSNSIEDEYNSLLLKTQGNPQILRQLVEEKYQKECQSRLPVELTR